MSVPATLVPVFQAYGLDAKGADCKRMSGGLIQETYLAELADGTRLTVQKVHPIFGPTLMEDMVAVADHLGAQGLECPRVQPNQKGELSTRIGEELWRVQSFLPGRTFARCDTPEMAAAAGRCVADFHKAVSGWDYKFRHVRQGVHDTALHLRRLQDKVTRDSDAELDPMAHELLHFAENLPDLSALPQRICHGDLKISNVLFFEDEPLRARCLIDLDTVGYMSLAYELGDAMRSWCNRAQEDDPAQFDYTLIEAGLQGYREQVGDSVSMLEWEAVVPGTFTVATELAARFLVDAYEDSYFGWDPNRFSSRRAHNVARSKGQLELARQIWSAQNQLQMRTA